MARWRRRTFTARGLTQVPAGPYLAELANASGRRGSPPKSGYSIGLYSPWAGTNYIGDASSDQYGNASGTEYDLVEDGAIEDARIVVVTLCQEVNLIRPREVLERKGFTVQEISSAGLAGLAGALIGAAELWIISDNRPHLTDDAIEVITSFFHEGRGLYIWGDNDPYFVDANRLLRHLFGIAMFGDTPGGQVVSVWDEARSVGLAPKHLITTGLANVFEGKTIAEVPTSDVVRPLIHGSNGRVVAAFHDDDGRRAIIDGGFTRLYYNWDSAGTDRYIVNAAAWLLNLERFGEDDYTS